jgi:hypothetical protein
LPVTRIPVELPNFTSAVEPGPCHGCEAHCCRTLAIPFPTPRTFMDFDYVRFMLNFDRVGVAVKD